MPNYTPDNEDLLIEIHKDILNRPDAYREGEIVLREQYGPKRLHQDALEDWKRFKRNLRSPESAMLQSDLATREAMREAYQAGGESLADSLEQRYPKPDPARWTPAACACQAIQGLLDSMGRVCWDANYQALLILAAILWDHDADRQHAIFTVFGDWDSRRAATYFLNKDADLQLWMGWVEVAWIGRPKPIAGITAGGPKPTSRKHRQRKRSNSGKA